MNARPTTVMIVAAEASGDALGAGLVVELRRRLGPAMRLVGVGGARLHEQGLESLFDIRELSVLGFVEGLAAYHRVVQRADQTAALAVQARPEVVVLIDSWGFTLRVAQRIRRRLPSIPLVKYVGPQVWASRPGRAKTLARSVDRLLTLYAMDAPYFTRFGLATTFVGAPALQRPDPPADAARARRALGAAPGEAILLVLPGSRPGEVARLGPSFRDAVTRLVAARPRMHVVAPLAATVEPAARAWAATLPGRVHVIEREDDKRDAFAAATVALACSGTVATELAMAGAPVVVAYRASRLTYILFKLIATTRYACLLNIAARAEIAPEFLQSRCTGARLAAALTARLDDAGLRARQVSAQNAALERLGTADADGAAARAADAVIETMRAGVAGAPTPRRIRHPDRGPRRSRPKAL